MPAMPTYRRKLIEVDLPLDAINAESRKDASQTHGHPSTIHKWWARRPLAACRAVIFASLVDDPADCPDEFPTEAEQRAERQRLHDLIKRLVIWKDSSNPGLLAEARYEIARSVARSHNERAPTEPDAVLEYLNRQAQPIYDPFCGGGSIPLEAQRLGLRAVGSDLNPVAVLITKALIELPPQFANRPPVNPAADPMGMTVGKGRSRRQVAWRGAAGLAADIRYYGRQMREMAEERIGHLYPTVKLDDGKEATVTVWLWSRTVPCPNPACNIQMPLVKTFQLQKNQNAEHYTVPEVDPASRTIRWSVRDDNGEVPVNGTADRRGAVCIACNSAVRADYIRQQARSGGMNQQMTAIIASVDGKRIYLSPRSADIRASESANPPWKPTTALPPMATKAISLQSYGWTHWHNVFTERQLLTLTTFCDLLVEIRERLENDGADHDYIDAIVTYLAFAVSRTADSGCNFTVWESGGNFVAAAFSRQGLGMVWDFPEANPFSNGTQNWMAQIGWIAKVLERLPASVNEGVVHQADASTTIQAERGPVIVTDPPYYDSMYYADTSDFFYAWLRPALREVYPELFAGIVTPKDEEIIANRYRFDNSRRRFEDLLAKSLNLIRERCDDEFPSSIFYAYKQQEDEHDGVASTGWETMLTAVIKAGFRIVGTWPMRTENTRALKSNRNQLASSVVLVCRPRPDDAPVAGLREFREALEQEMPPRLDQLTREAHIAPVDLRQAAIGLGMAVYSRYQSVATLAGEPVTVHDALIAINNAVAAYLQEQAGELDSESRFCLDWLREYPGGRGDYGTAETLARAYGLSVDDRLEQTHQLLDASQGQVTLYDIDNYGAERGYPAREPATAWECCLRMAWQMQPGDDRRGVAGCAAIARRAGDRLDSVERLARILYDIYNGRNDSPRAVAFNNVATAWPEITQTAARPAADRLLD